jgi:hypothetical protein
VIANMPLAGMRPAGWTSDTLREIKLDIILASATAYGEGGPYSDRIGFDGAGQVMSGATYRQGCRTCRSEPWCRKPIGTALTLTIGVMMALTIAARPARASTWRLRCPDRPDAVQCLSSSAIYWASTSREWATEARRWRRDLTRSRTAGLLQVAGQPMFKRWCRLIGREDSSTTPRSSTTTRAGNTATSSTT